MCGCDLGVRAASGIPRDAAFEQAPEKRCHPLVVSKKNRMRLNVGYARNPIGVGIGIGIECVCMVIVW